MLVKASGQAARGAVMCDVMMMQNKNVVGVSMPMLHFGKTASNDNGGFDFTDWILTPCGYRYIQSIMTTKSTSSSRRRLLVVAGLLLASGGATSASDHQAIHRPQSLPRGRRHLPAYRNCANADINSHSRLLLSKALFFSGQPVLSFVLASRDEQRRVAAMRCATTYAAGPSPSTSFRYNRAAASETGLQIRGGVSSAGASAALPILELAQELVSVGAAALVGAALTIGERVFTMLGWELPSIFGRKNAATGNGNDIFGSANGNDIFGSANGAAMAVAPAVPYAIIGFAASSTAIGACLVVAAVAVLAINPSNAANFFVLDGLAILVTLLGILVAGERLDFVSMLATRGVLPLSILLGLLGFLGFYA